MASLPPVKKKGRGFERAPSNGTAPSTSTNGVAGDSPVSAHARARGGGGGGAKPKSKKNTAKAAARGVAVSASAAAAVRQKPKAAKQRRNERERRLGEAASRADLARVSFAVTNHFHTNEVVLVPRSRGGFVYGAVQGSRSSTQCPHDAAAVHRRPHRLWRIVYPNFHGQSMFKDLCAQQVGKLPDLEAAAAAAVATPVPASSLAPDAQPRGKSAVGVPATERDLLLVVFSPAHDFEPNETVLVPRSHGGFTYGIVTSKLELACSSIATPDASDPAEPPPRHMVAGWRVISGFQDGQADKPLRKDLFPLLLGKLHSSLSLAQAKDRAAAMATAASPVAAIATNKKARAPVASTSTPMLPQEQQQLHNVRDAYSFNENAGTLSDISLDRIPGFLEDDDDDDDDDDEYGSGSDDGDYENDDEDEEDECDDDVGDVDGFECNGSLNSDTDMTGEEIVFWDNAPHASKFGFESFAQQARDQDQEVPPAATTMISEPAPVGMPAPVRVVEATTNANDLQQAPESSPSAASEPDSREVDDDVVPCDATTQRGGLLRVELPATAAATPSDEQTARDKPRPKHNRRKAARHLVVIDAPNVAMKHGKSGVYSAMGIKICIDYWLSKGHDVIAFLPSHYITAKPSTSGTARLSDFMPKIDNVALIKELVDRGLISLTPPQDYDDSYCIRYAQQRNGVIVSNDLYRDHIDKIASERDKAGMRRWLREHIISFTFVRNDFLPNPDFKFPTYPS